MKGLFFLFLILFIRIYSEIKNNPIYLDKGKYLIVLSTEENDYYYIITDKKNMKIEKDSGITIETNNMFHTLSNYIYVSDKSYNNYIINDTNKAFYINYNPFMALIETPIYSLNFDYQNEVRIMGSIGLYNEFIIYGYYNNQFFFSSKFKQSNFINYMGSDDNSKITCKFMSSEYYICASIINNKVSLICLFYTLENFLFFTKSLFLVSKIS